MSFSQVSVARRFRGAVAADDSSTLLAFFDEIASTGADFRATTSDSWGCMIGVESTIVGI